MEEVNGRYTVGWICSTATEYAAARLLLDRRHDDAGLRARAGDANDYTLGSMGRHDVVMACLRPGERGVSSAAGVAKDMLRSFGNIRIGLAVGTGGGAPGAGGDVRLGDVVVSTPGEGEGGVLQYDFGDLVLGREEEGGSGAAVSAAAAGGRGGRGGSLRFRRRGFLNQPAASVRSAVGGLAAKYMVEGHELVERIERIVEGNERLRGFRRPDASTDRLYRSDVVHPHTAPPLVNGEEEEDNDDDVEDGQKEGGGYRSRFRSCAVVCGDDPSRLVPRRARDPEREDDPAIHHGLIASSNGAMRDARARDALAAGKGVLCFETEAAGLMNHFPFLVVRGICHYADSHQDGGDGEGRGEGGTWEGFAAMMAAAYARDLLGHILPNRVEAERRMYETMREKEKEGEEETTEAGRGMEMVQSSGLDSEMGERRPDRVEYSGAGDREEMKRLEYGVGTFTF